jgi:hypothetical protein
MRIFRRMLYINNVSNDDIMLIIFCFMFMMTLYYIRVVSKDDILLILFD